MTALVWDRLSRSDVDQIIAIQSELQVAAPGGRVLRRLARLLSVTVPTLDRAIRPWRRCRASTVKRMRTAIATHAGRCFRHDECAAVPEMGRACFLTRTP